VCVCALHVLCVCVCVCVCVFSLSWSASVSHLELELIVGAQQQCLLVVCVGADVAVATGEGRPPPLARLLQRGLLRVLLVGGREVVDGVLDHVPRVHGLLQAAGDALHGGAATCRGRGVGVSVSQQDAEGGVKEGTSTHRLA